MDHARGVGFAEETCKQQLPLVLSRQPLTLGRVFCLSIGAALTLAGRLPLFDVDSCS
jgi:hypothetical protein